MVFCGWCFVRWSAGRFCVLCFMCLLPVAILLCCAVVGSCSEFVGFGVCYVSLLFVSYICVRLLCVCLGVFDLFVVWFSLDCA